MLHDLYNSCKYYENQTKLVINDISVYVTTSQCNFIAKNFREAFPVDTMGKSPLCMAQYLKLLCSCRIPQPIRDEVFVAPKGTAKHVLVAHKNQVIIFGIILHFPIE